MTSIRIRAVIEFDGELHLSNLPCRRGDQVEAIVILPEGATEQQRRAARQRLVEHARSSSFRSAGPYPSREELHERA